LPHEDRGRRVDKVIGKRITAGGSRQEDRGGRIAAGGFVSEDRTEGAKVKVRR
jgi:hypothetical protein